MAVGRVTRDFPAMQGARSRKEKADAYVVALAQHKNSNPEDWRVVADETTAKRKNKKIPGACEKYGIRCRTLLEMLADEFPEEEW